MRQERQSIQVKRSEIKFRRDLSHQELSGEVCIPSAFSKEEIIPVVVSSMEETRSTFNRLKSKQITLSPFLEIGAERGQRSFVLSNDFGAWGFALDLSMDALLFGNRLMAELNLVKSPIRICGDAYTLPFHSNTFPFVFCMATLHHFPDPAPIVQEMARVLHDGGYLYFDREPTHGKLNLKLWTRTGYKLSPIEKFLDKIGILGFVSQGGGIEREYGILENTFPLDTWMGVTSLFSTVEMQVNRFFKIQFDPAQPSLRRWLGGLVGGVTRALCLVEKESPPLHSVNWLDMLRCPTCSVGDKGYGLALSSTGAELICSHCGTTYPQQDGVFLLLPADLRRGLYPQL